jgi:hypothetical protein
MLSHTQVVDLRCHSAHDPYRIQDEVPLLQIFSQSPGYDPIPRWVGVHGLYHKFVGLSMDHAVASVATIFVGLFAPVQNMLIPTLQASSITIMHASVNFLYFASTVDCPQTTTRHTRGASFMYFIQSASKP